LARIDVSPLRSPKGLRSTKRQTQINRRLQKEQAMSTFQKGDRVNLIRLDGTVTPETFTVHDLWGDAETSPRNASFISGNQEQYTHTDLMRHADDTSPVVVPDGGEWFIAIGNDHCWGRASTADNAARNMRRNGKPTEYVIYRCTKWTSVSDMGGLTYPSGVEPVEVKRVASKRKVRA
jgi:hypothetical protein